MSARTIYPDRRDLVSRFQTHYKMQQEDEFCAELRRKYGMISWWIQTKEKKTYRNDLCLRSQERAASGSTRLYTSNFLSRKANPIVRSSERLTEIQPDACERTDEKSRTAVPAGANAGQAGVLNFPFLLFPTDHHQLA